jgi:hypothetical protein
MDWYFVVVELECLEDPRVIQQGALGNQTNSSPLFLPSHGPS